MSNVIALVGNIGAGKDTVASILSEKHGYKPIAFAARLKALAGYLFHINQDVLYGPSAKRNTVIDLTEDQWRQTYTELKSHTLQHVLKMLFWDEATQQDALSKLYELWYTFKHYKEPLTARVILQQLGTEWGRKLDDSVWVRTVRSTVTTEGGNWVITDCRFPNEGAFIKNMPEANGRAVWLDASKRVQRTSDHASEPTRADFDGIVTYDLDNNGSLAELEANIETMLTAIFRR